MQYNSISNQRDWVGLRKNQNLRIDLSPDPSSVEVLKIASIVVQVINIDNAELVGKIVKYVAKRTILPKVLVW